MDPINRLKEIIDNMSTMARKLRAELPESAEAMQAYHLDMQKDYRPSRIRPAFFLLKDNVPTQVTLEELVPYVDAYGADFLLWKDVVKNYCELKTRFVPFDVLGEDENGAIFVFLSRMEVYGFPPLFGKFTDYETAKRSHQAVLTLLQSLCSNIDTVIDKAQTDE